MKFGCLKRDCCYGRVWTVVVLSWVVLSVTGIFFNDIACQIRIFFALASASTAFYCFREFGDFCLFRVRSKICDEILISFMVMLATILQYAFFESVFNLEICTFYNAILLAVLVASLAVIIGFGSELVIKSSKKQRVVLDLSEEERSRILFDFRNCCNIELLTKNDLRKAILAHDAGSIDLVVISRKTVNEFDTDGVLIRAHLAGVPVVDFENLDADISGRVRLSTTDEWAFIMEATKQTSLLRAYHKVKMFFEPLCAALLLLALSPLFLVIALLVKRSSAGPVFFKQVRIGHLGRKFTLIKFRSMYSDAEVNGPQWCQGEHDQRITPFGAFLRRTRLDELPQLINVIRGEMGFIGPRPERPEMYSKIKESLPMFQMRTLVRPGITGWAQVCAGYAATIEESKTKLEFDLYYIKRMSPVLDCIILFKTVVVALMGEERVPSFETYSLTSNEADKTNVSIVKNA